MASNADILAVFEAWGQQWRDHNLRDRVRLERMLDGEWAHTDGARWDDDGGALTGRARAVDAASGCEEVRGQGAPQEEQKARKGDV